MTKKHNANKRVKKLFSEIKDMANQPLADVNPSAKQVVVNPPAPQPQTDTTEYQREIERLNARVREMEALLNRPETGSNDQKVDSAPRTAESIVSMGRGAAPSAPILYEKEQVGYVFKDNNLTPIQSAASIKPSAAA